MRLFAERSRAGRQDFSLSGENAGAVARICRRLDGIPLAIELAAARVRAMSVEQIASRLDDVFRLLTGGSRAAMPRQQTLKALFDWSYDLLEEQERLLPAAPVRFLRRLGSGGCGIRLRGRGHYGWEVLDLLSQLVDKSLVVAKPPEAERVTTCSKRCASTGSAGCWKRAPASGCATVTWLISPA